MDVAAGDTGSATLPSGWETAVAEILLTMKASTGGSTEFGPGRTPQAPPRGFIHRFAAPGVHGYSSSDPAPAGVHAVVLWCTIGLGSLL